MPNHTTISTASYRVELSPHLDLWMRGARYGTVIREYRNRHGRNVVVVKMDYPLRNCSNVRVYADDVTPL